MIKIRIGGVPEHFNMPWHYAMEHKLFEAKNIALEWSDYPGGTGAMNQELRDGTLDVAVILTEGAVADIAKGSDNSIFHWYVASPLRWGIHVAENSAVKSTKDLKAKKYAISRFGSGSHLMAYVDAFQRGFTINEEQFVVVNTIDGAVKSLTAGESDIFMWEKFMTKPYVDKGILRRVGECPTPWPSFVLVVRNEFLAQNKEALIGLLEVIQNSCKAFSQLPDLIERITKKYNLLPEDVKEWANEIVWQTDSVFNAEPLEQVAKTLFDLGIIKEEVKVASIVSKL